MTTGLAVFDRSLQTTNEWLKEFETELGGAARHTAYASLRATLHALRDRLSAEEAAHLGAQLPMMIRGVFYEGWRPGAAKLKGRTRAGFIESVERELRNDTVDAERAARSVFRVLTRKVTAGEILDIQQLLPHEIRDLWP